MKAIVAKAVLAFQSIDEYNTILFQWYFKGFELLRRYLIKHGLGTDLEELDFEAIDKEMEEDEVALATQAAASIGADPSQADKDEENAPPTWTRCPLKKKFLFFFLEKWLVCFKATRQLISECSPGFGAFWTTLC